MKDTMSKLSVVDLDLMGQRVFVRVDFNVPLKEGEISDDTRIRASLPTIKYALEHGATVVAASHLGRPKGKPNPQFSLKPVAVRLAQLLGRGVTFTHDCIGADVNASIAKVRRTGGIVLLENLRFHPEEEQNDPQFSASLASLADQYVDDAFGAAHRAHAVRLAQLLGRGVTFTHDCIGAERIGRMRRSKASRIIFGGPRRVS
jgi:phosphoglycerate kinase